MVLAGGSGTRSPARHLANDLTSMGVDARLFGAADMADVMARAHIVLVGADAVAADFLLNGTPTLELASAAAGVTPFYVVCETIKLTPETNSACGYDRVPLKLITGVVTEVGILAAAQVAGRIANQGLW